MVTIKGLPWVDDQSEFGRQSEASSYINLGEKSMNEGRYQEAHMRFTFAMHLAPEWAGPYLNLGILYTRMGKDELALRALKQALRCNPRKKGDIYNIMGSVYTRRENYDLAIKLYSKSLVFGINRSNIWGIIGELNMKRGNYPEAIKAFQAAIDTRPTLRNSYIEMLNTQLYIRDSEDNVNELKAQLEQGILEEETTPYNLEIVERFLKKDNNLINNYLELAGAYEKNGQIDAAIAQMSEALNIWQDMMIMYNQIGILYAKAGRYEEAQAALEEALRLDPGNRSILINIEKLRQKQSDDESSIETE